VAVYIQASRALPLWYDGNGSWRRSQALEIDHDGMSVLSSRQAARPWLAEGQSALLRAISNLDEQNRAS
jgi:hypothetical protein